MERDGVRTLRIVDTAVEPCARIVQIVDTWCHQPASPRSRSFVQSRSIDAEEIPMMRARRFPVIGGRPVILPSSSTKAACERFITWKR
jgi:hypothetical protein